MENKKVKDLTLEEMHKICAVREQLEVCQIFKDKCEGCPLTTKDYKVCLKVAETNPLYQEIKDNDVKMIIDVKIG